MRTDRRYHIVAQDRPNLPGSETTFLEVNPNGQFGWLDDPATWPLHDAVLEAVLCGTSTIPGNEAIAGEIGSTCFRAGRSAMAAKSLPSCSSINSTKCATSACGSGGQVGTIEDFLQFGRQSDRTAHSANVFELGLSRGKD